MSTHESAWLPATPKPIALLPAANMSPELQGRRAVIGLPGNGWRADMRADNAVTADGATYVPVLAEADYYRAELEDTEMFAPLVPVSQVWIEDVQSRSDAPARHQDAPRLDLFSRLVSMDEPPCCEPVPARDTLGLTGRRVVVVSPGAEQRDLRAVTEPYQNQEGDICVRICREPDWYQWAFTGQPPKSQETPIYLVWAE